MEHVGGRPVAQSLTGPCCVVELEEGAQFPFGFPQTARKLQNSLWCAWRVSGDLRFSGVPGFLEAGSPAGLSKRSLPAGPWSDSPGRSQLFRREARLVSLGHYRYQRVVHRLNGQQGLVQGDCAQQAGFSLFSEYHCCGELLPCQLDFGLPYFYRLPSAGCRRPTVTAQFC